MTGDCAYKLAMCRMGDTVSFLDHGQVQQGQVVGWTSEHTGMPMMLVYGDYHSDRRVPLHAVLSRGRLGVGVVRF